MKGTLAVGRIWGIPIRIHYSWFAVLGLFSWILARGFLPSFYAGWSPTTYWTTGVVATLFLFGSVLVHELAHSVVARFLSFRVEGITLFFLGGVSQLKAEAQGPRDEFVISVVGPVVSLVLAGLFWLILQGFQDRLSPVSAVLAYLVLINILVAGFNLLPAFPLDGGRILRSAVWAVTGSFSKATTVAATGGQVAGILLIAAGLFAVLRGNVLEGFWAAIVGWFLFGAARGSRQEAKTQDQLQGVLVQDVMERQSDTVTPDVSLSDVVYSHLLARGGRAVLVCDTGGDLVGIVAISDANAVPRERWGSVSAGEAMTPVPLWSVGPEDPLARAVDLMVERSISQVPVLDSERLAGVLTTAEIAPYLRGLLDLGLDSKSDST